jgi:hypothetical protein
MSRIFEIWARWKVWLLSVLAGALLGCICRLFIDFKFIDRGMNSPAGIMTIAFLVFVPFAMGYLGVHGYLRASTPSDIRWHKWILLPWASVLVTMLVSLLVKWEGWICLIFAAPIMLFFSLLGGFTARLFWGRFKHRSPGTLSAFALPLLLLIVETHIPAPDEIRTVNSGILIHAPAGTVWNNIKSVRAIAPTELPGSWVGRIGFPNPVAATLSHEGIGGVRQASFTGGLVFTETVNRWEPEQDLRFSIHANTDSIPPATLDEHVTVGGAFFDVLDGEYRLEQRPDGVLLHLSSRERLSTHFNPYAGRWTDAVMKAIQEQILAVIRNRCELQTSAVR